MFVACWGLDAALQTWVGLVQGNKCPWLADETSLPDPGHFITHQIGASAVILLVLNCDYRFVLPLPCFGLPWFEGACTVRHMSMTASKGSWKDYGEENGYFSAFFYSPSPNPRFPSQASESVSYYLTSFPIRSTCRSAAYHTPAQKLELVVQMCVHVCVCVCVRAFEQKLPLMPPPSRCRESSESG